jgi:hypothetical protein
MGRRKVLHRHLILFAPSVDKKQKRRQIGCRSCCGRELFSVQIAALYLPAETSCDILEFIDQPRTGGGVSPMLIHTAEGKHSIDDDLVLCIDRHRGETERCIVTVYLLNGEQVTGVLETTLPDEDAPPLAA